MASNKGKTAGSGSRGVGKEKDVRRKEAARPPGWAYGLRQLYDSVVEEPLPDSFKDLLSKLDAKQ
jgi:hypothetical protein